MRSSTLSRTRGIRGRRQPGLLGERQDRRGDGGQAPPEKTCGFGSRTSGTWTTFASPWTGWWPGRSPWISTGELQRFKENSNRAREIAVSEEEVARYEERLREIDQMGMTARELYQNTAGEIEARDVTARRQLTPEQRRQTMPDTGDENTVFAERAGDNYSVKSRPTPSRRKQIGYCSRAWTRTPSGR